MLDAPKDRTRVTSVALPLARPYDAEEVPERRSAAEPFRPWLSASYVINVLPLKAEIKHRVSGSPPRNCSFELEITFCVRGVTTEPCGVPFSRFTKVPSGIHTGACNHLSMY